MCVDLVGPSVKSLEFLIAHFVPLVICRRNIESVTVRFEVFVPCVAYYELGWLLFLPDSESRTVKVH